MSFPEWLLPARLVYRYPLMNMKKLNWKIIKSNITEAREELEAIEEAIESGEFISEAEYQIKIEHAYHHLNVAWNARHSSDQRYKNMTDRDFNKWSKIPKNIEETKV